MNRAFPVEGLTHRVRFRRRPSEFRAGEDVQGSSPLLRHSTPGRTIHATLNPPTHAAVSTVSIAVHRFEDLIGGHPYLVENAFTRGGMVRAISPHDFLVDPR
jgi:hypothetical protein